MLASRKIKIGAIVILDDQSAVWGDLVESIDAGPALEESLRQWFFEGPEGRPFGVWWEEAKRARTGTGDARKKEGT